MKLSNIMVVIFTILIAVVGGTIKDRADAQSPIEVSPGVTVTWLGDNTWQVSATVTDTSTVTGTPIVIDGSATYYRDGSAIATVVTSTPLTLTVGSTSYQKVWLSTSKVNVTVSEVSGGTAEITAEGKLKYTVTAKNDGKPVTVTFKIKRVL